MIIMESPKFKGVHNVRSENNERKCFENAMAALKIMFKPVISLCKPRQVDLLESKFRAVKRLAIRNVNPPGFERTLRIILSHHIVSG